MIWRLILQRLAGAILTLLIVSAVIFVAIEVLPGDVASRALGRFATEESKRIFREQLHLEGSVIERYGLWLWGVVHGDFGESIVSQRTVTEILAPKLRNTFLLAAYALLIYFPLSTLLSSVAAVYNNRLPDHIISVFVLLILSIPEFVLASVLLIVFSVITPIFPAMSVIETATTIKDLLLVLTLPAVTLALAMSVYAARMLRDSLIEVLDSEYVRMAMLKGLPRYHIIIFHALPNALIPALNVTGLNLAYLIGGVVVVERVFTYSGIGSLLVESIFLRDVPIIEAVVLVVSAVYILANLFTDVMAIVLNPRLRRV